MKNLSNTNTTIIGQLVDTILNKPQKRSKALDKFQSNRSWYKSATSAKMKWHGDQLLTTARQVLKF